MNTDDEILELLLRLTPDQRQAAIDFLRLLNAGITLSAHWNRAVQA